MNNIRKNDILSVLKEFTKVIKSNNHKTPSPELNENLNVLKKVFTRK